MVVLGGWLDLMILEVFSNLWFYDSNEGGSHSIFCRFTPEGDKEIYYENWLAQLIDGKNAEWVKNFKNVDSCRSINV